MDTVGVPVTVEGGKSKKAIKPVKGTITAKKKKKKRFDPGGGFVE